MSDIFKKNIKEWVTIDNELKLLKDHITNEESKKDMNISV